ncbi:MAG: carbohydrate ABC transporter permease, partial [Clostridia bacterium]
MKRKHFRRFSLGSAVSYLYLSILTVFAGFPLLWILLSSFKSKGEITGNPTGIFPKVWTLDYYKNVLQALRFDVNIGNSVLISLATTVIAIVISSLAAYGIVRFFPRFGKLMTRVLITTYMFPPILLAIPYSIIMGGLGLSNTRIGLIIVYLSFSVPYAVWLLVGFFRTVPIGIEEAARVDGANKLRIFRSIVLPIVAPGVVAVAIYTFINAWNEFLYSLILMNSTSKMTVSVALKSLEGSEIFDWGTMMAASALVVV